MTDTVGDGEQRAAAPSASAGPSAGSKFLPDGTARYFPGNTIISFVSEGSAEALLLARVVDQLRSAIAEDFVLLPATSWHMTLFELLCDTVRDVDRWSSKLSLDASLESVDEFFAEHVPTVVAPAGLDMTCQGISADGTTLGLQLDPTDSVTADALRRYRTALSEVTGVRQPGHDNYGFHITLAYRLRRPESGRQQHIDAAMSRANAEAEGARLRIPAPVLTYFSDMTHFAEHARPAKPRSAQAMS